MCLLLKHGARVNQRNKLGLNPVHVAATNGNIQALQVSYETSGSLHLPLTEQGNLSLHLTYLQILLHKDPGCVDAASEMKETPLFFAVKNNFIDCAQLLLCYGASSQVFNLRLKTPLKKLPNSVIRLIYCF